MENTGEKNDKEFVSGTDEVTTTSSADMIAAPADQQSNDTPPENISLTEHTKDLAAKAMIYIQQYGMLAGAVVLTTAATVIIARRIIRRKKR